MKKVRMSEELKRNLILNDCEDHVKEFGDCEGIIVGKVFEDDEGIVDVRWQPSGLKYMYDIQNLIVID